ncbi:MAG: DUF4199 domain-containing protein [Bacteroidota bacterium]|nr:DUF4199 domain-containing protein [Bacteroidota bacterium]MEC8175530.1 DUF4199 domain-containing protein [Bacteroidota bacterium]MEC8367538.1 DUF4199 domain-containing protein [Bacteroidota bacterium]MEC8602011.1 DUF4199 domain-containing protein [Bacteroidota bacterium]
MESISSKKIIYQYGLLTGLVGLVWGIVQFIMGTHYENDTVSQIVGSIILIVGIVLGQLAFRKENNGIVAYSQCLKIGVGISLIQAIIGLIYYYLLTNFIEPDFNVKALQLSYAQMVESNPEFSAQMTEQSFIENSEPFMWIAYPAILLVSLFFGLLFSLCTGIFIKKSE